MQHQQSRLPAEVLYDPERPVLHPGNAEEFLRRGGDQFILGANCAK